MPALRDIDRQTQELRDSYWDDEIQASKEVASVLLVEGDDDKLLVEEVFRARRKQWETSVRVIAAGGRKQALGAAARFKASFVLVDRDTRTDDEARDEAARRGLGGRLNVTSGWCLENIFLDPDFLHGVDSALAKRVADQREKWVRAEARWWALQRTRETALVGWNAVFGPGKYGGLEAGADPRTGSELADLLSRRLVGDPKLQLALDIDAIAATFDARLGDVQALPEREQWNVGVHGKRAFEELVCPLLKGRSQNWRVALVPALSRPFPAPLDALAAMFLP